MAPETDLFNSEGYIVQIEDLFMDSFTLTADEINQRFDLFNKANGKKISLSLSGQNKLTENFSFIDKNVYKKEFRENETYFELRLTLQDNVALDIENFLMNVMNVISMRLIVETTESDFDFLEKEGVAIWVLDPFGSIVVRNRLAKKIIGHKDFSPLRYGPQICCVGDIIYLIVSDPKSHDNYFYFYAFEMSDEILRNCASNLLKNISLEASILSHDLKNPLTGIKFGAELLKMEDGLSEVSDEISKSVDQCEEVIKVFLDFYKGNQLDDFASNHFPQLFKKLKKMLGGRGELLDFSFSCHDNKTFVLNDSLFIITLYLVFGEVVDLFLHQQQVLIMERKKLLLTVSFIEKDKLIIRGGDFCELLLSVIKDSSQRVFFKSLFELNNLYIKYSSKELIIGRL